MRSIFEAIMLDAMFEIPGSGKKNFRITLDYAIQKYNKSGIAQMNVAVV
ncbi:MAG: hypothetical protein NZ108_08925 [Bacteroidia bacterium]|nr:hypothetical protein [Bacteroidia bacterium]